MEQIKLKDVSAKAQELTKNVGRKVFELRKQKGWTQSDLAFRMCSDKSIVSAIENGRCINMTAITLIRISEAFGIGILELFV